ncbi:hypothetical protein PR048_002116 [Dryococelus australis]|uniref:Uncharacterized protein n=1 Tax=Dryococelus australis TaxID=614101 RepID=A0ABQ9IJF9_9NEOP|nr:hypothetical protein PR048_002116 [Dryococelus australis]
MGGCESNSGSLILPFPSKSFSSNELGITTNNVEDVQDESAHDLGIQQPVLLRERKRFGRIKDVPKKFRLQSHATKEKCVCRKKCFECVGEDN